MILKVSKGDEQVQFIAAVQEGLRALEEGRVISHAEVKARFNRHKYRPRKGSIGLDQSPRPKESLE